MSDSTKLRIQKVAKELGYAPNFSARVLTMGRTNALGVAIRDLNYIAVPYIGSVVSGIAEISDECNFNLSFVRTVPSGNDDESEYIRFARERRFDGMIIIDQIAKESEIRLLCKMGMPVVTVDRKISRSNIPIVRINYRKATKDATSRLIQLGHRRIAALAPTLDLFDMKERMQGYTEALSEHGLAFDENLIRIDERSDAIVDWARSNLEQLEALPSPPTAYLSFQDTRTSLICDILRHLGLRIPQDISVIGFETTNMQCPSSYSISVVKTPGFELGVRACQLLLDVLKNRSATKDVVLEAEFDARDSCAVPGR